MTVGVVFMSEIPVTTGKKHDQRFSNPHNEKVEKKKKENGMTVFSIEDASSSSNNSSRKSSVNNSTSASSNNSIDTKTRQSKRQALKNILLGPVRNDGKSRSLPGFHNSVPLNPSEAHVNDPIFYYIQSSQNCPCEYHDQLRRIEGERAIANLSKTMGSEQSKTSSSKSSTSSSLYETPIRTFSNNLKIQGEKLATLKDEDPNLKKFQVNVDVHEDSNSTASEKTEPNDIRILHTFEVIKDHFQGQPMRKFSLGQDRQFQFDPIPNFRLPHSVSTSNIGEIATQHMKNSLIRKNPRKFSLDLTHSPSEWPIRDRRWPGGIPEPSEGEIKNYPYPDNGHNETRFFNVIDEFNAVMSHSLRKPSAILSSRKHSLNIPQHKISSEFDTVNIAKSGSMTNLTLVDQVSFLPVDFARSSKPIRKKSDNQRSNMRPLQAEVSNLNLPSLIVEESLQSKSPTPGREIRESSISSMDSKSNIVILKISQTESDYEQQRGSSLSSGLSSRVSNTLSSLSDPSIYEYRKEKSQSDQGGSTSIYENVECSPDDAILDGNSSPPIFENHDLSTNIKINYSGTKEHFDPAGNWTLRPSVLNMEPPEDIELDSEFLSQSWSDGGASNLPDNGFYNSISVSEVPELIMSATQSFPRSRSCTLCSDSETGASKTDLRVTRPEGDQSSRYNQLSTYRSLRESNVASFYDPKIHEFFDQQPTQLPMCLRNIILQHVQNAKTFPEGHSEEASLKKRMSKFFVVPVDPSDPAAFTETFPDMKRGSSKKNCCSSKPIHKVVAIFTFIMTAGIIITIVCVYHFTDTIRPMM